MVWGSRSGPVDAVSGLEASENRSDGARSRECLKTTTTAALCYAPLT